MTYWQYWNLDAVPFTSGRQHFFHGQSIEEALARIEFICGERRNLATLLGPAGVGKTTLLNFLVNTPPRQAEKPLPKVCAVSLLGLSVGELPLLLARQLCGRQVHQAAEAWKSLADFFSTSARHETQILLLIDDVESCGAEAETDLIRLVRAADDAHVSIILSIETHLASTVSRWLLERSYLQIELPLWDLDQTHDFLTASLERCGRTQPLFSDSAVVRLHELSRGTARRLVQLADLALIAGAVMQSARVDDNVIAQVAQELPRPLMAA